MSSSSRPAFVVGISGHMDLPESDLPEIRARLCRIFAWLREDPVLADRDEASVPEWWPRVLRGPVEGKGEVRHRPLPGLGLGEARIVLLSSLAPGTDTLAAEVALDLGWEVRAPLPFPAALYRRSTSFTAPGIPTEAVAGFDALLANPARPVDAFAVLLETDQGLAPAERERRFEEDLGFPDRRRLRYRAAGEYVAAHSHLMLALYQPGGPALPESIADTEAGTEVISYIRRRGPTPGILPAGSHFPWLDSGETFHLPVRSLKRLGGNDPADDKSWLTRPARLLPPEMLDCAAEDDEPTDACVSAGLRRLSESARLFAAYEAEAADLPAPDPDKSLTDLFGLANPGGPELSAAGRAYLEALAPLAVSRRTASTLAGKADSARGRMMAKLAACAFFAAVAFHGFAHWHFKGGHAGAAGAAAAALSSTGGTKSHDFEGIALMFLALTIGAVVYAGVAYYRYCGSRLEWLRFDARALAEGLRVQAYWFAAGLPASVAANYMHRQKNELDWIRNAISSLAFPYDRWKDRFDALPIEDRRLLLGSVLKDWLNRQKEFFARNRDAKHRQMHRHHVLGWGLTWAGIAQAGHLFAWKLFPESLRSQAVLAMAGAMFLAGVAWILVVKGRAPHHPVPPAAPRAGGRDSNTKRFFAFLDLQLHPLSQYPVAVAGAGLIALLSLGLSHLPLSFLPPPKDLWIILTGATLVSGAICIAWGEKLALAENTRQYTAMHDLFQHALTSALRLYDGSSPTPGASGGDDATGLEPSRSDLAKLHALLADLGKEALAENAEWLLLHRSRPLEPFLAG